MEEFRLAFENLLPCRIEIEPRRPVDFRKILYAPRARRPFDAERIADETLGIPVIFDGPSRNQLSARLPHRAEGKRFPPRTKSGLFRKFTDGRIVRILAIENFTLWNGPGTVILVPPVRSSGVCQKHLQPVPAPV